MKVYLVEDIGNCPGRVWVVMASEEDANTMAEAIAREHRTECEVVERTLFYGQPPRCGFNE